MTYSGNLCAKSRPVDIVLQIAHFLLIKDSLSCKEAADSDDSCPKPAAWIYCTFTDGGDDRRCDSKVYHCSLKMELSIFVNLVKILP